MNIILCTEGNINLVTDDSYNGIKAQIDGGLYDPATFVPLESGRRTLRDESKKAIVAKMLSTAEYRLDCLIENRQRNKEEWKRVENENKRLTERLRDVNNASPAPVSVDLSSISSQLAMIASKLDNQPKETIVKVPDKSSVKMEGILHKDFERILSILSCGFDFAVYLYGPAGTGKSYICKQLAKAMNVDFYTQNCVTDEVQINGFIDAHGNYHETEFYRAFVNGGLFLLDELDASVPEVLVSLNNALANGYYVFPCGKVDVNPNFRCVASGNTNGSGANDLYTGRCQLDAASMDRFSFIEINYDRQIELGMANNDESLVNFAHDVRKSCENAGLSFLFTYRSLKRLATFDSVMSKDDCLRIGLLKGICTDDIQIIYNGLMDKNNQWAGALLILTNNGEEIPF